MLKRYNYHSVLLLLLYQVCKKMFLLTLDISQSMVESSLKSYGEDGHKISKPENRGGNTRTPDDVILAVTDHIDSFPRVSSHIYKIKNFSHELILPTLIFRV